MVRAKEPSAGGQEALRDLCAAYYAPVLAFLRQQGLEVDAGRELAHAFFERMLEGGTIHQADQERGRFRSYLLGSMKHFLAHQREAAMRLRRGGGMVLLSLEMEGEGGPLLGVPDESQLSPDAAFDRQWALTVLARALAALKTECEEEGRGQVFETLQPWLTGEAEHGDQAMLAESLAMNVNSLKSTVHRLKQRFRFWVREEIACTLEDESLVEAEMGVLFAALKMR